MGKVKKKGHTELARVRRETAATPGSEEFWAGVLRQSYHEYFGADCWDFDVRLERVYAKAIVRTMRRLIHGASR